MIAMLRRECKAFWHSWFFYTFCACFFLSLGVLMSVFHVSYQYANFEFLLSYLTVALGVLLPILTIPLFREERKRGVARFLRSLPLSAKKIVLGKYLSLLFLLLVISVLLLLCPLLLGLFGTVYYPSAYMAIFAFFLFAFAILSVDVFISLLCRNLWVSLAVTYGITGGLIALVYLSSHLPASVSEIVLRFSLFGTFVPFSFGIVDLRALIFYASVGTAFLLLTALCSSRLWKE